MIKSINIKRAGVGSGLLEPIQCSQNLQIAINTRTHLTVLDPQLPRLHQCVSLTDSNNQKQRVLDGNALFNINTVFPIENLESLGFQIFSKILVEDGESHFNFGRIAEPVITQHEWLPIDPSTRDSYLGVLLNSGEVFVLKRDTTDPAKYCVKARSFPSLVDQMNLSSDQLTPEGDIILTNSQFLHVKVNSFAFARTASGDLICSLAHENGQVSIHQLREGLPLIASSKTTGPVVKQKWSQEANGTMHLATVHSDNSVELIRFDPLKNLAERAVRIALKSRFLVSQLDFLTPGVLLVVDAYRAVFFDTQNASQICHQTLSHRSTVTGLAASESGQVLLLHETGRMSTVNYSVGNSLCSLGPVPQAWKLFVNKALYKYQLLMAREQDKGPSELFQPFLSDNIEGNFWLHGALVTTSGLLVFAYSISPKNVIHHEIRSKFEFNVGFVRLQDLLPLTETPASSIGSLHLSFIRGLDDLPLLDSPSLTDSYIQRLAEWKKAVSAPVEEEALTKQPDLTSSLAVNIRDNHIVQNMQRNFLLNLSVLSTLDAFATGPMKAESFSGFRDEIVHENKAIMRTIQNRLCRVLLAAYSPDDDLTEVDKYLLINCLNVVGKKESLVQKAQFTENSSICIETFATEANQSPPEDFLDFAVSTTGHKWRRCSVTMMPILSLVNKTDELEQFVFLSELQNESNIIPVLVGSLSHCIYTGTRTFDVKIGL